MKKLEFCENFVFLDKAPITFTGRGYLDAIYAVDRGNLVLRASRQVEKSTFLANSMVFELIKNPGARILFVAPREEQARTFSRDRFLPIVQESPCLRRALLGKGYEPQLRNMQFANGSKLYFRAAFRTADACRGLSADLLYVDEVQDIAPGDLPVLQEVLSHAAYPRTILAGTPKMVDNHLEGIFNQSTANVWAVPCDSCGSWFAIDERCLGAVGPVCPECQSPIDPTAGTWYARNEHAYWGEGFSISHLMVPWLRYDDILDRLRSYDPVRFRNEVLGLPTTLGEHVVTRAELEACCTERPAITSLEQVPVEYQPLLVAGIDWGGGVASRTVVVIGSMREDYVFEVLLIRAFQASEEPNRVITEVARLCNDFQVVSIAADGAGNGFVYNRLLFERVRPRFGLYAIVYAMTDSRPTPDGALHKWTVHRSGSIGVLFSRVKQQRILFPRREDCDSYLDEFACETAIYDDKQRAIRYTHPDTQPDDCLHATNYALSLATRAHQGQQY